MYIHNFPDVETVDTNIRGNSPETSQGIKIMTLEKEIKIRVSMFHDQATYFPTFLVIHISIIKKVNFAICR